MSAVMSEVAEKRGAQTKLGGSHSNRGYQETLCGECGIPA